MASSSKPQWNYDVFLSFRGEDTRKNFVGHLYTALKHKGFLTFKDDLDLKSGKEITPELENAIEGSRLAIIVFSADYASSSWCLNELVKILECRKGMGQIVLPVFYKMNPSHVRKQTESFAAAFTTHEKDYAHDLTKVQRWRDALREAACSSGLDTENTTDGDEAKCIQEIVRDVYNRLGYSVSNVVEDLVGIDSRVEEVLSLLGSGLDDVRVVGIWGMGGIGKTTLAKAVYNRISHHFEGSSFLAVGEILEKRGPQALQQELFSIVARLRCERLLVVLDDVDQNVELEVLLGRRDWISSGSRIIITTRDAHSLTTHGVSLKYEVKALDESEALQLFSSKAFKQSRPAEDYMELSYHIVDYAGGLPLALKVLGSSLFGRNINEWRSTLKRLENFPDRNILKVLKISFDGLHELEKQIFLDIACFFKGHDRDYITRILDGCDFEPDIGLSVLIEKSLITVSSNTIEMHALIQEMGWHSVRQEDPEEPGRRSRLWIPNDVCQALMENTVTNTVEGMSLDLCKPKDVNFNTEVFKEMTKLRLLKVHNAQFSRGPEYLSNKLSWLVWKGYPSSSLPKSFKAAKLVELCMHYSRIIELWKGTKILDKLKTIDLRHSQKLRRTPDFTGLPNLEELILEDCTSLVEVHPSIAFHRHLILLNLKNCRNLKSLPNSIYLKSLKTLILSGCLRLEKFPEVVDKMECLSVLYLDGTAIKELSSSIEQLTNLVLLDLNDCRNLGRLPNSICRLRCLRSLDLSGCIKLEELPPNFGDLEYLEELYVGETGIKRPSSFVVLLKNLKSLSLHGYKETALQSSSSLFASCFLKRESQDSISSVLQAVSRLHLLKRIDISSCNLFDWQIPSDFGCLSSLEDLNLSRNNIVNIPASINQLSRLKILGLVGCNRLEALLNLPTNIAEIFLDDCTSLGLLSLSTEHKSLRCISSTGCSKLLEYLRGDSLADMLLEHVLQCMINHIQLRDKKSRRVFSFLLPGSEIPEWFIHQNMGRSVSINLPPDWFNDKPLGLAICVVTKLYPPSPTWCRSPKSIKTPTSSIELTMTNHDHQKRTWASALFTRGTQKIVDSEHVYMGFLPLYRLGGEDKNFSPPNLCQLEVSIPGYRFEEQTYGVEENKVGMRIVYEEEILKMGETMLISGSSQSENLRR